MKDARRARGSVVLLCCCLLLVTLVTSCGSTTPAQPGNSMPPAGDVPMADTAGPAYVAEAPKGAPTVVDGYDWTMPDWVRPAEFSGFFSEKASVPDHVLTRAVDVSWKQISPGPGKLDLTSDGQAQGLYFDSLQYQLAQPGPFWFRMFASGVDWAPQWVIDDCGVGPIGKDYDDQQHLPIWDPCVWGHLRDTWALLLKKENGGLDLLDNPAFRFAYIPGGFTWGEFDYEMQSQAARKGALTEADYLAWYRQMVKDFVALGGDRAGQLVFTGEDYPWGPWKSDELLASEATGAGLGIRNGITEQSNFHLNETPAYGSQILPNGHLLVDESLPKRAPGTVVATENECYVDCGLASQDPAYVVMMSDLKALQLQMNWIYVVPGQSLLDLQPELWDWVRLSMGQRPETSPDAWAALRDAEDVYWRDENGPFGKGGREWRTRPFVRNYERWLVQTDVPGAMAHRSTVDVHRFDPTKDNGVAYEGLQTDVAHGDTSLAFELDPRFLSDRQRVLVKVTFFDDATGSFRVRTAAGASKAVRFGGTAGWRTATFAVDLEPGGRMPVATDLWVDKLGPGDASFAMVRVVRLQAPAG